MDILVEKTENNEPIFDTIKKQVDETKESIDSNSAKAKELIHNIKLSIAKVLYKAQFDDFFNQLDSNRNN